MTRPWDPAPPRPAALDRALERFAAAVGGEHVIADAAALEDFRDPFSHPGWQGRAPAAAVLPQTVEEVQAIVRIAAEHGSGCGRTRPGATTATAAPGRSRAAR